MKRTIVILPWMIICMFILFSFRQGVKIKDLKNTQKAYKALTVEFMNLNQQYAATWISYELLQVKMQQNQLSVDSLLASMKALQSENRTLYDSITLRSMAILAHQPDSIWYAKNSDRVDLKELFNR